MRLVICYLIEVHISGAERYANVMLKMYKLDMVDVSINVCNV
jgi:hypothetical protein